MICELQKATFEDHHEADLTLGNSRRLKKNNQVNAGSKFKNKFRIYTFTSRADLHQLAGA
jgi:hypothetical protein